MKTFFVMTTGRMAGWGMFAFVGAVVAHSILRTWHFSDLVLGACLGASFLFASVFRSKYALAVSVILSCFILGWWRFERAPIPQLRKIDNRQYLVRQKDENSAFAHARQRLTQRIAAVLPLEEANLVTGILYGVQDLTATQKNRFRDAGLMHIVAVSGSNVTIVVQFVTMIILGAGFKRRQAFWIAISAIALFVAFVGFAPPVARAAFMGGLFMLARRVGRIADPIRLLLVAAVILLTINPWQLMFDIGFALSFLAMWGVIAWAPIFETWLTLLPKRFEIRSSSAMTLAATLTTGPYAAWMFGRISLAGLFTNVVALPLVPFIMGWGAVAVVWGTLPGSMYVSAPVHGLIWMIDAIAASAAFVPGLNMEVKNIPFATIALIYLVLLYLSVLLKRRMRISTQKEFSQY